MPGSEATRAYRARVDELAATVLDDRLKGVALGEQLELGAIAQRGWNVARGDVSLPALTLDQAAVSANLATMQRYCERHGVRLAPHGKTTMSPQLFADQLDAGAWAITAATPTQVAVMRRFGVPRIILANELVAAGALRWIAAELARDPDFEFYCLVDDADTVRRVDETLAGCGASRPLAVLVEIGPGGGRGGVRSPVAACAVAEAVRGCDHLTLRGVEAFEGVLPADAGGDRVARIDELLRSVRDAVMQISARGLFDGDEVIVTAGGSMYFDRVIELLGEWPEPGPAVSLVLRSGCYVTHDGGDYERMSPLAGRRPPGEDLRLRDALTLWASVLSRPEPGTVIVGAGLRDAPVDRELPRPRSLFRDGEVVGDLSGGATSFRAMDQHLFVTVDPSADVRPGDLMTFDLSHPCTAFDKHRFIPLVDDTSVVTGGILTFF